MFLKVIGGILFVPAPFMLIIAFLIITVSVSVANVFTLFVGQAMYPYEGFGTMIGLFNSDLRYQYLDFVYASKSQVVLVSTCSLIAWATPFVMYEFTPLA